MHTHDPSPPGARPLSRWREPLRITFWLFLGLAVFYLVLEHRVHLLAGAPWLPFLLLALCPLMHVFGHAGHGRHRYGDATPPAPPGRDPPPSGPARS